MLFIYQYPDWTNFRYSKASVMDFLCRARYAQGKLQGKSSWTLSKSSAEALQKEDFEFLLKIDGVEESLPVLFSAARNFSAPMTEKRLLSLHASLFRNGGRYRENSKEGASLCGVHPGDIQRELQKLFFYFNSSQTDAVLKAAVVLFWFSTIHPFESGSGILARLLTDQLLSKSENSSLHLYSLNREIFRDREAYFSKLREAQTSNGDITEWILWFLSKFERALSRAEENFQAQFESVKRKISFGEISLTERERRLVESLEKEPEKQISSSEWAKEAGISHDSALRDFKSLLSKKVLLPSGGKGRSSRYWLNLEK